MFALCFPGTEILQTQPPVSHPELSGAANNASKLLGILVFQWLCGEKTMG